MDILSNTLVLIVAGVIGIALGIVAKYVVRALKKK